MMQHRFKRDADVGEQLSLESLLLPDPQHSHVVDYDLILDDDQFSTVITKDSHKAQHRNILSGGRKRSKRKAIRHSIYHWPGAEVPYEIHSSVGK